MSVDLLTPLEYIRAVYEIESNRYERLQREIPQIKILRPDGGICGVAEVAIRIHKRLMTTCQMNCDDVQRVVSCCEKVENKIKSRAIRITQNKDTLGERYEATFIRDGVKWEIGLKYPEGRIIPFLRPPTDTTHGYFMERTPSHIPSEPPTEENEKLRVVIQHLVQENERLQHLVNEQQLLLQSLL